MRVQLQADSDDFAKLSRRMSHMIRELQRRSYQPFSPRRGWKPSVNLYEDQEAFVVCVDLAGMKPDQIDVRMEGRFMIIRGDRPMPTGETCGEGISIHLMEIDSGPFTREVEIPDKVDPARISAAYKDGFLWVSMPKRISSTEEVS